MRFTRALGNIWHFGKQIALPLPLDIKKKHLPQAECLIVHQEHKGSINLPEFVYKIRNGLSETHKLTLLASLLLCSYVSRLFSWDSGCKVIFIVETWKHYQSRRSLELLCLNAHAVLECSFLMCGCSLLTWETSSENTGDVNDSVVNHSAGQSQQQTTELNFWTKRDHKPSRNWLLTANQNSRLVPAGFYSEQNPPRQ